MADDAEGASLLYFLEVLTAHVGAVNDLGVFGYAVQGAALSAASACLSVNLASSGHSKKKGRRPAHTHAHGLRRNHTACAAICPFVILSAFRRRLRTLR